MLEMGVAETLKTSIIRKGVLVLSGGTTLYVLISSSDKQFTLSTCHMWQRNGGGTVEVYTEVRLLMMPVTFALSFNNY